MAMEDFVIFFSSLPNVQAMVHADGSNISIMRNCSNPIFAVIKSQCYEENEDGENMCKNWKSFFYQLTRDFVALLFFHLKLSSFTNCNYILNLGNALK